MELMQDDADCRSGASTEFLTSRAAKNRHLSLLAMPARLIRNRVGARYRAR